VYWFNQRSSSSGPAAPPIVASVWRIERASRMRRLRVAFVMDQPQHVLQSLPHLPAGWIVRQGVEAQLLFEPILGQPVAGVAARERERFGESASARRAIRRRAAGKRPDA
jgi:hypothetical protein